MIRGKFIAILLGSIAGALGIGAVLQGTGLGRGYATAEDDGSARSAKAFPAIAGEPAKVKPFPTYAEILNRPLFNESRAPEEVPDTAQAPESTAAGELNATLSGIIITKDARLAIVTNTANGEAQRVRVGQPLEGDLSGWALIELSPRLAVFEGSGAGRKELELMVDTKGATAPAPPPKPQPAPATPGNPQAQQAGGVPPPATPAATPPQAVGQPATADEIRRRIEERRKQLREEAQRMLQEQEQNPTQ